jgi:uncharacterized protein YprB with RNaseH-like and TPR domain
LKENPDYDNYAYLDIETTNLAGTFGYIFSYCLLRPGGECKERVLTRKEILSYQFDKNLIKQFVEDIQDLSRFIVYYGKSYRFDVPYLRTRSTYWGMEFPSYGEVYVTDVFDIIKSKFKLHRNRLEDACRFFDIPCKQHHLNPTIWQRAMAGCPKSLEHILKHNREDVESLKALYEKIQNFSKRSDTSI